MTVNQLWMCKVVSITVPVVALTLFTEVGVPLWCALIVWFLLSVLTSPLAELGRWGGMARSAGSNGRSDA